MFDTAGLVLLHHTISSTENSSINQRQPLIMVKVKLVAHELCECTALTDSGASVSFILLYVVIYWPWAVSMRFSNRDCLCLIGQSIGLV